MAVFELASRRCQALPLKVSRISLVGNFCRRCWAILDYFVFKERLWQPTTGHVRFLSPK